MWNAASTEALHLSLRVSAIATLIIVFLGTPLAFWLARRPGSLAYSLESLLSLPLVIPPVVTGYLLLLLLSPAGLLGGWLDRLGLRFGLDWKGAVVASMVLAFPLFLAIARVAFERCDKRLEEAAKTLHAGPVRVLLTITLPPALPGLAAGAAVAFARAFGEFGATMMLAGNTPGQTRTVSLAVYSHFLAGRSDAALGLVLVCIAAGVAAMAISQLLARPHYRPAVGRRSNA